MPKTEVEHFIDWESHVFGFGYGTGEQYTITALKDFLSATNDEPPHMYDYRDLDQKTGWFLINTLCHAGIIEYGVSPRFGWLSAQGACLRDFISKHSAEELINLCCDRADSYIPCYPDACNCGERGYEKGRKCGNPFWRED